MWLILANAQDEPARWAAEGLKARGLGPVELVTDDVLACSRRWEHRVGAAGADLVIELADGRTLHRQEIGGVLNRLMGVPQGPFRASPDVDYALQELNAFYMSWLAALPGAVLNPPSVLGLGGAWRHASEWVVLAARAGLPTLPYRQSSRRGDGQFFGSLVPPGTPLSTVIVTDGALSGAAVPSDLGRACSRFAALAGLPLLGIDFLRSPEGGWRFAGATPCPDLRLGGETFLDQLVSAFTAREEVAA